MISVSEAKDIVKANSAALPPVTIPLQEAAGLVLAEEIFAVADIPAFDQSSMDGYALNFNDYHPGKQFIVTGEVPAGYDKIVDYKPGQAVRIFTGAPVPAGADTVVMQEKVSLENGTLLIQDTEIKQGMNVRPKGSEIKKGDLALAKGTELSPAAVGFLAGIGIAQVLVYPKPKITLIVTGKELQQPGQPLQQGQVYESNSFTLKAVLKQLGITNVNSIQVDDDLSVVQQALATALQQSDVVLLTGGISVGDYDFVGKAVSLCEVTPLFHKVKQRPGKPLYVGKKETTLVFGLPGNPSSVLTCFYEYVLPALAQLSGTQNKMLTKQAPLTGPYTKKKGLTHFLKGYYANEKVVLLDAQESYRLRSFAIANCLIVLEEEKEEYEAGDKVEVHLLP